MFANTNDNFVAFYSQLDKNDQSSFFINKLIYFKKMTKFVGAL